MTNNKSNQIVIFLIRHENRYPHGLANCSLTYDGIYSSQYELPQKIITKIDDSKIKITNIYCSPLLRTCQTIYPFAKNNNYLIKLDESLYELVNKWTNHYTKMATTGLPILKSTTEDVICLYYNQYKSLTQIRHKINMLDKELFNKIWSEIDLSLHDNTKKILQEIRKDLDFFNVMMNDDRYTYISKYRYHYDPNIKCVIENITYCILFIDGILVGCLPDVEEINKYYSEHTCYNIITTFIDDSLKLLELYNIVLHFDKSYKSIFDISQYLVGFDSESFSNIIDRTSKITYNMLNLHEYQNSVYVSHLNVINAIIVNIFKSVYNQDALKYLNIIFNNFIATCSFQSFENFCEKNPIPIGSVHRIVVDLEENHVCVEKF